MPRMNPLSQGYAARSRAEELLHEQGRILERIARGDALDAVLSDIVRLVEGQLLKARLAVLVFDGEGAGPAWAIAPDLPADYVGTAEGTEPGPYDALAARKPGLTVSDIGTDPAWRDHRRRALSQGLRTCWSVPLRRSGDERLGVFALHFEECRQPSAEERERVLAAARLAELVLDRHDKDEALRESDGRYRSLFHAMDEGFCILEMIFDEDGRPVDYRFLEVNPTFEKHTGLAGAQGRTARDLVPDLDASWFETYGRVARTGESTRFSNPAPAMGRWFDTFAFRVGRPEQRHVALLFKDVTQQVSAETALRESERRHRTMADFRRSVMRLTEEGLEAKTTEAFYERILREAVQVIPGAEAGSLLLDSGEDRFRFAAAIGYDLEKLRRVTMSQAAAGFGHLSTDRQPRIERRPPPAPGLSPEALGVLAGPGRHHEILAVLIVPIVVDDALTAFLTLDNFQDEEAFTDESVEMTRVFAGHVASLVKRFALEEELQRLAYRDSLTGLPNRAMFREHLERVLADGRADGGTAVMFVDLDNLKPINDSLGHSAGDDVLRAAADRLGPLAGPTSLVARVGGDEFTVVVSAPDAGREARHLAERILVELARPIRTGERELHISASIGISVHPDGGAGGDDLLRHADIAMYHAKQRGKNAYAMFTPEMEAAPLERLLLEEALREGLEKEQFVLHYQPRVDMRNDRIVCVEALVRWQHPERGVVPPGLFIPLAENTNLIHPLGQRILQMAVREARRWRDAGHTELRVAVNLSARQLDRPAFVDEVRAVLEAEGLPASALELEVLESVAMDDVSTSAEKLLALKELGVSIALDDFGMGYSSLAYLRRLPIDTLKIDRTFLEDLGDHGGSHDPLAIVRAMTQLGNSFGMRVVAEGVEERMQWERLRSVGCHEAQGFVLARPVPAKELWGILERETLTP